MPWARSLGQEDPLEEDTATHSSILAWRTPWTEERGGVTKGKAWLSEWSHTACKCGDRRTVYSLFCCLTSYQFPQYHCETASVSPPPFFFFKIMLTLNCFLPRRFFLNIDFIFLPCQDKFSLWFSKERKRENRKISHKDTPSPVIMWFYTAECEPPAKIKKHHFINIKHLIRVACCSPWGRKELDRTEPLNN